MDDGLLQIHITPTQRKKLASTHPSCDRRRYSRMTRFPKPGEQLLYLVRREDYLFDSRLALGHFHSGDRVLPEIGPLNGLLENLIQRELDVLNRWPGKPLGLCSDEPLDVGYFY